MIRLTIIVALLISFFSLHAQVNKFSILIKNITVISADENGIKSQKSFVLTEGEILKYIGNSKPEISGEFAEIDGEGKFLIPGLIDSHVHLANTAGLNGTLKQKYPELVGLYFKQLPKSYLYFGFTTLIDLNNYAPNRINQITKSEIHPDIFTCGQQVEVMNDFMMEMEEYSLDERYQSGFLYDRYNSAIKFPDSIRLSEHTPQRIIADIKKQCGICAKIVYEDEASGLPVSWAKPTGNILKDLVAEAQKDNMPVVLHAPSIEGHKIGLEADARVFAHGFWNWTDDFSHFRDKKLNSKQKSVLKKIAQKQIGYQLTFRAITGESDLFNADFLFDNNLKHCFPKAYLDILKTEEGDWGRKKILARGDFLKSKNPEFYWAVRGKNQTDEMMWNEGFSIYKNRLNKVAKFMASNNAMLLFGTDTPAMNMVTNPPGYNGLLEIKHWYEAGIGLEQIFKALTFNNSKIFNLRDLYGSVEKGKIANLLILKDNPLNNIDAYNTIESVIVRGKVISRNDLSAENN